MESCEVEGTTERLLSFLLMIKEEVGCAKPTEEAMMSCFKRMVKKMAFYYLLSDISSNTALTELKSLESPLMLTSFSFSSYTCFNVQ